MKKQNEIKQLKEPDSINHNLVVTDYAKPEIHSNTLITFSKQLNWFINELKEKFW